MIDLFSDFVAKPTEAMWDAMQAATPADLARLETLAAGLLGKEASVWLPTCSAANLVALLTLCEPGDRVALVEDAHILTTEGMGIENVARLVPVALGDDAVLVCVENTHTRTGGAVLTVEEAVRLCGLAPRAHLDGARLPNAAAALGVAMTELAAPADTVALSLNKGLCAPYGAVLAGEARVVEAVRENARRIGAASVHKAHVAAAAGVVALEQMLDRIAEDNARARALAERLAAIEGVSVASPETNIVFFSVDGWSAAALLDALAAAGVRGYPRDEWRIRFVTHNDIGDADVERAAAAVASAVT